MKVYEHSLYAFELIENQKILRFNWSATTKNMAKEDYQEALHNYAGFGLEYRTTALFVNVRNFRYTMTAELGIWRDEHIFPRYIKAEVKKFGYLVPKGILKKMKTHDMQKAERGFAEDYFEDEQEAIKWLTN